jgi:hypothetical protein
MGGHISLAQADQMDDLIQRLKSQDVHERRQAAKALGKLTDPRVMEPLIALLQDQEAIIRLHIIRALRQLGDRRAVFPLMQVFKEDSDWLLRMEAAEALEDLGDHGAVPLLIELLGDLDFKARVRAEKALRTLKVDEEIITKALERQKSRVIAVLAAGVSFLTITQKLADKLAPMFELYAANDAAEANLEVFWGTLFVMQKTQWYKTGWTIRSEGEDREVTIQLRPRDTAVRTKWGNLIVKGTKRPGQSDNAGDWTIVDEWSQIPRLILWTGQ